KTPFGERERMLGGSAVHFSLAASFFGEVHVVGPVGEDFGPDEFAVLESRGVQTGDIERVAGGETFFWRGHYDYDLNVAHTDDTQLTVFGDFEPKLSEASRQADLLFLANIQPDPQSQVRAHAAGARFAGGFLGFLDTRAGEIDEAALRQAMGYGTVLASFNVEEFGTERVQRLTREEIDERMAELHRMTQFEALPDRA